MVWLVGVAVRARVVMATEVAALTQCLEAVLVERQTEAKLMVVEVVKAAIVAETIAVMLTGLAIVGPLAARTWEVAAARVVAGVPEQLQFRMMVAPAYVR